MKSTLVQNFIYVLGSMKRANRWLALVLATSLASNICIAEPWLEENVTKSVENSHFDTFRVASDAVIPLSRKIYVGKVESSFARNWMMQFKAKTSRNYRKQTLDIYGQTLRSHITKKLTTSGWKVVDTYEEGIASLKIRLKDIYINGPEKTDMEHALVANIGQLGIDIIIEGADNQTILEIEDYREAGGLTNFFIETDNAVNFTWFNKLMKDWARDVSFYLDIMAEHMEL